MSLETGVVYVVEHDGKSWVEYADYVAVYNKYMELLESTKEKCVTPNYEGEYHRLLEEMDCIENHYCELREKDQATIEEYRQMLAEYKQRWSVIELIFGKR